MVFDEIPDRARQFERAIATAFTCRSVIKYNSTLSEEQKNEILAQLDGTLQFLQKRLIANVSIEASSVIPPLQLAEILSASRENDEDESDEESALDDANIAPLSGREGQTFSDSQVYSLYKLYHTYLDTGQGKGIGELETRYKIAMTILDDAQGIISQHRDTSAGDNDGGLIYRVQAFMTALYSMFLEFSAMLGNILEGKSFSMETDELTSLQKYTAREMLKQQQHMLRDITPLMRVYGAHLQFQQRKGTAASLVSDATAFLIFLEGQLGIASSRRREIVDQLKAVSDLLNDLLSLLSQYEQALSSALTL